ncbi:uncharacterized protein PV06_11107 [Exophiala oligosperma]|uniref:Uncharacterized protein n=1 Tax=Exophiala oligosperma TaxID=215243 RepID=A0A0D2D351_9EURO|nr:uncharacterized protein PV06_11107 [Exophiala oligosperma]KIW36695.1 hypothetical protein PV06_11107 [Exophiala oligosperma]
MSNGQYNFRFLHEAVAARNTYSFSGRKSDDSFRSPTELDFQSLLPSTTASSFSRSFDVFRDGSPLLGMLPCEYEVNLASRVKTEEGVARSLSRPVPRPLQQYRHINSRLEPMIHHSYAGRIDQEGYCFDGLAQRRSSYPQIETISTNFRAEILEEAHLRDQTRLNMISMDILDGRFMVTVMESLEEYRQLEWAREMLIVYREECSQMCLRPTI